MKSAVSLASLVLAIVFLAAPAMAEDALPSWNDGAAKQSIIEFVERVTRDGGPEFVPPAERIAVFDNDGTLWTEQPVLWQLQFAIDRVRELASEHPEWRTTQPFQAAIEGDMRALAASGERGLLELVMATHAGMTVEEFAGTVRAWFATARHPATGRSPAESVYQPMLELLEYLRSNGFRTFIVSGGGVEFMRVFTEELYGVPPEQVVGSSVKTEFEMTPQGPVIRRLSEIDFIDDKEGKPLGINQYIGRRPIAAFGNSDGDLQMLQWTAAGDGERLCLLVHHTDAERETAYDRDSHVGRLDEALDEARRRDWVVVDMRTAWRVVFPD